MHRDKKIGSDRCDNFEPWKAVKKLLEGISFKDNGKSGGGCVINGLAGTKSSVPLTFGSAMAADVAGVCVLAGICDLIFYKWLCAQSVNQYMNRILKQ